MGTDISARTADDVGSAVSCSATPLPFEFGDSSLCAADLDAFLRVVNGYEDTFGATAGDVYDDKGVENGFEQSFFSVDSIPW